MMPKFIQPLSAVLLGVLAIALLGLSSAPVRAACPGPFVFDDRLEIGVSDRIGNFRIDALEIQHPHLFVPVDSFGVCGDVTFDPLVVFGSEVVDGVNPTLADQIEDLELNLVVEHNPMTQLDDQTSCSSVYDTDCDSPTQCQAPELDDLVSQAPYTVQGSDICLGEIDGLYEMPWPDGRTTDPNEPEAGNHGCFVTEESSLTLQLAFDDTEVEIPLVDVVVAAAFNDQPADRLDEGVIVGFLTQEAADDIVFSVDTDLGEFEFNLGQDILPSGDGFSSCESRSQCSGIEARAVHEGDCGWWFVLNFEGQRQG